MKVSSLSEVLFDQLKLSIALALDRIHQMTKQEREASLLICRTQGANLFSILFGSFINPSSFYTVFQAFSQIFQ